MWKRVLLVVGSVAVTLLAVEFYFRTRAPKAVHTVVAEDGSLVRSVFEPSPELRKHWSQRLERMRKGVGSNGVVNRFSARYGWANVAGGSGQHQGLPVSFNAIGARGSKPVGDEPPEGALRLACYGESFTFGSEVGDGDTWPAQLDVDAAGALEVVNLGVGGWGTDQALMRYRDTRDELAPDVVLMGLLSENIARNVNRLRPVYSPKTREPLVKPRFILVDGALELVPQPYATEVDLYQAAVDGSLGIDMAPHEWWAPKSDGGGWSGALAALNSRKETQRRQGWFREWLRVDGEPYQITLALMETFHREAEVDGVRFAGVILFPTSGDIGDPKRKLTELGKVLEQRGIPYLDLYDLVRARKDRGEKVYGKSHFTPEANGEVAERVWQWLRGELEI
jgi:hypothetical protein